MKVRFLSNEDAMSGGADLWILPSLQASDWTRRLDWPLNLLVTKASLHTRPELAPQLKAITIETEMVLPPVKRADDKPLLIYSEGRLPNRMTVIVSGTDTREWVESSLTVWRELRKPSMRLFLPQVFKWEKLGVEWPDDANTELIQIVEASSNAQPGE